VRKAEIPIPPAMEGSESLMAGGTRIFALRH